MFRSAACTRSRRPCTLIGQIIAVTGSVGKTGTKEALRLVLTRAANTRVGCLYNIIGAFASLARLPECALRRVRAWHESRGELTPLSQLVRPPVALVTTIERVHIDISLTLSGR